MVKLRLKEHPATFWEFEDATPSISIGRDGSNDISLLEQTLSRNHAAIVSQDGAYILRADATHNVTQVNNETITSKRLREGDEIRLGKVVFIFDRDDRVTGGPEESTADGDGAEAVDIYKELLDIPEGQRPPNHYQLIGVKDFESSVELIKRASLNCVAALKKRQLDPRFGDAVQQLLTEVARSRVTLCNLYGKSKYDNELKRKETIESGIALAKDDETYQLIMPELDMPMEERLDALRRTAEFMILEADIDPKERDKMLREEAKSFDVDFSEVERIVREVIAVRDSQPPMEEDERTKDSAYNDLLNAGIAWIYDNILTEPLILFVMIGFLLIALLLDPSTFFLILLFGVGGAAIAVIIRWMLSSRS